MRTLTEMQEKFAEAYVECGLAVQAAKIAGYKGASDNNFSSIGCKNLRHPMVRKRIEELREKRRERFEVSRDVFLKCLYDIASGEGIDPAERRKAADCAIQHIQGIPVERKDLTVRTGEAKEESVDGTPVVEEIERQLANSPPVVLARLRASVPGPNGKQKRGKG